MAPYLDPINQAAIDALVESGLPPLEELPVSKIREVFDQITQPTPIPGVLRRHFEVPFEYRQVKAYLFRPEGVEGLLPTIEYIHGGGFIAGTIEGYDTICRQLVLCTGFAVVFVEYSLAPEKKFPTQQEECFAVAAYINEHGARLGLKAEKIALVGDSAGGQLVIAVAQLATKRRPKFKIAHQTLICPFTDLDLERITKSEFDFFDGPFFNVPILRKAAALYLPHGKDRQNPLVSPVFLTPDQAAKLPQSTVVVSSVDALRTDGETFAQLLQRSGVDTVFLRGEGLVHDAFVLEATRKDPTCLAIVGLIADRLKAALEPSKSSQSAPAASKL